ncbi:MAG: 4-alpha-glucanotransferase [Actinobacteria bacterium]|nr:4-alpha-glucanotransferase [Actinomycetota bacterium]
MSQTRSAGILLHPTSLDGGNFGRGADAFVEWLGRAGVAWWQTLPLGPADHVGSPYASPSAFAIAPRFVSDRSATVTSDEREEFVAREGRWIHAHTSRFGNASLDDQVRADREWIALRSRARERDIRIIGDLPIYVSANGVEHEARPELFVRDFVAGCPPDAFTQDGQLWGNPLYDWEAMRRDGYAWWIDRLRRSQHLADLVRVDHFRGFAGYWAVPASAATAREGMWFPGPGSTPFLTAREALGEIRLIAEDLGVITPDVEELRDGLGLPGMRVLQFALDGGQGNPHRPEHYPTRSVAYTGTHDNDTLAGWIAAMPPDERDRLRDVVAVDSDGVEALVLASIDSVLGAKSELVVIPMQDILGLGSDARMNFPGTLGGNWSWRLPAGALTHERAEWLRDRLAAHDRLPSGRT